MMFTYGLVATTVEIMMAVLCNTTKMNRYESHNRFYKETGTKL